MRILFLILFISLIAVSCKHSTIVHPVRKHIVETVYASGKIISGNEYNVNTVVGGTILKKLVKEGDTVSRGQVLYVIRNAASVAKMEAASNNYNNAKTNLSPESRILAEMQLTVSSAATKFRNDSLNYARLNNLYALDIGTRNNLDAAYTSFVISRNQLRSAEERYHSTLNDLQVAMHNVKSQLVSAQTELENYSIRSESNGVVFQTFREAGETVRPNDAMALLGSGADRVISLAVDQQDIDRIKPGQTVLLKTDITGNRIYHAVISRIYPVMNQADQTFRVDAIFTTDVHQQFIHSSVEANIIIAEKNNVLVIPRNALLTNDSIQVMHNDRKKTIAIETGIRSMEYIEVVEGLDESTKIIMPS